MILALPTFVNCKEMNLFEGQDNIVYNEDAKITIDNPLPNRYNISWKEEINDLIKEVWVRSSEWKAVLLHQGIKVPIIVIGEDPEIQPYSMKDRLVYLQDQLNKGKLNV